MIKWMKGNVATPGVLIVSLSGEYGSYFMTGFTSYTVYFLRYFRVGLGPSGSLCGFRGTDT